jgi:hypothetical protein
MWDFQFNHAGSFAYLKQKTTYPITCVKVTYEADVWLDSKEQSFIVYYNYDLGCSLDMDHWKKSLGDLLQSDLVIYNTDLVRRSVGLQWSYELEDELMQFLGERNVMIFDKGTPAEGVTYYLLIKVDSRRKVVDATSFGYTDDQWYIRLYERDELEQIKSIEDASEYVVAKNKQVNIEDNGLTYDVMDKGFIDAFLEYVKQS